MNLYTLTAFRIHKKNIARLLRQCGLPNDDLLELPLSAADLERIAMREHDIRAFGLSSDVNVRAMWTERERERFASSLLGDAALLGPVRKALNKYHKKCTFHCT